MIAELEPTSAFLAFELDQPVEVQQVPYGRHLMATRVAVRELKESSNQKASLKVEVFGRFIGEWGVLKEYGTFYYAIAPAPEPPYLDSELVTRVVGHYGLRHSNPDRCGLRLVNGDFYYHPAKDLHIGQSGRRVKVAQVLVRNTCGALTTTVWGPTVTKDGRLGPRVGMDWHLGRDGMQQPAAAAGHPELVTAAMTAHRSQPGMWPA